MRMVVAYIDDKAFGPLRTELHALGVDSLSITAVNGSVPGSGTTVHPRGATLINHLCSAIKLECVVAAKDVSTIVEAVTRHERPYSGGEDRVFVVPVEVYADRLAQLGAKATQTAAHVAALA